MRDYSHVPSSFGPADVQIFKLLTTTDNLEWMVWNKPRGKSMMHIFCIGGGAGASGGTSSDAGVSLGAGGKGGGASSLSTVTIPLALVPDRLFIQVGAGGAGGTGGTGGGGAPGAAGGDGILSYVCIAPDSTTTNRLLISGAAAPTGGAAGGGSSGGVGGTVMTAANAPLVGLGVFKSFVGQDGTDGGSASGGAVPDQVIPVTGCPCMGGLGGGGKGPPNGAAGGAIAAISSSYLSEWIPPFAAAETGHPGFYGPQLWNPFFSFPGMGGGGSDSAAGSAGGSAVAYGAGGGGGGIGGGTAPGADGGAGGSGGNGLVIITCW